MDKATTEKLQALTNSFYEVYGTSFSETRQGPWEGWRRVGELLGGSLRICDSPELCDIACGNGRFERFLLQHWPEIPWDFTLVDSSPYLLQEAELALREPAIESLQAYKKTFETRDILRELQDSSNSDNLFNPEQFEAMVSFGFMHHIPGFALRKKFIQLMVSSLKPRGIMALSFWRFADDPTLKAKAEKTTATILNTHPLNLESNDFLLGWQGSTDYLRYCHSFTDEEIDWLLEALETKTKVLERYKADGRTGKLNEYLILEARV